MYEFADSLVYLQCSIDAHGDPLTDETLAAAKGADAVLLGSIGGPKWGTGAVRPEQGLLKLRKEMGTYGNLRPCFFASDSLVDASPLKAEVCRGTDFVIVRELTGGIYFGERKEDDGSGSAWDMEPYSRAEIERVARLAGFLARGRGDKKVWSLDKANVLATSRLWRKVMTETFEKEFPDLKVEHQLIDSAAMIMVKNPTGLNGVVVTSNLFGDIISDEASVIPGSIGLLPSASLSGIPDGKGKCNGIYEPIHGKSTYISLNHPTTKADPSFLKVPPPTSPARALSTPSERSSPSPCSSGTPSTSTTRPRPSRTPCGQLWTAACGPRILEVMRRPRMLETRLSRSWRGFSRLKKKKDKKGERIRE